MRYASLLLVLALSTSAVPADATSIYCHKFEVLGGGLKRPEPPYCLDGTTSMKDKNAYERCRDQLDKYDRDVGDYVMCLSDESRDAQHERYKAKECLDRLARGDGCY